MSTELATTKTSNQIAVQPPSTGLKDLWTHAKMLADSDIIPKSYQHKPNNCLIAIELATRLGSSPLLAMQSLHIVAGKPTWSSQFLIATVNHCGRFSPLRYRFGGQKGSDSWSCVAYATEKETGEILEGPEITIGMAKSEGWATKEGSKWKTMPQLMLMYRSAAFWARVYSPEVAMGLHTQEEIEDTFENRTASGMRAALAEQPTQTVSFPQIPPAREAEFEDDEPEPPSEPKPHREPGDDT